MPATRATTTHRRARSSGIIDDDIAVMAHIGWIDARNGASPRHERDSTGLPARLRDAYLRGYARWPGNRR